MSVEIDTQYSAGPRATGSIEVRAISESEWRISDLSIPVGDAGSVLGFAEMVDETNIEVLRLGHGNGIDKLVFRTLDEVVTYFAHAA